MPRRLPNITDKDREPGLGHIQGKESDGNVSLLMLMLGRYSLFASTHKRWLTTYNLPSITAALSTTVKVNM